MPLGCQQNYLYFINFFISSSLCIVFYHIKCFGYLKQKQLILFNNIFKLIIIRLDNAAAAISLDLDLQLCRPHTFQHCGTEVTDMPSCRKSVGHHFRHAALNDIIHRALSAAHVPSRLELPGLARADENVRME